MERRPKRVVWHFGQLAGLPPTVGPGSAITRQFCWLAGLLGVLVERGILGITAFAPCFINFGFPAAPYTMPEHCVYGPCHP